MANERVFGHDDTLRDTLNHVQHDDSSCATADPRRMLREGTRPAPQSALPAWPRQVRCMRKGHGALECPVCLQLFNRPVTPINRWRLLLRAGPTVPKAARLRGRAVLAFLAPEGRWQGLRFLESPPWAVPSSPGPLCAMRAVLPRRAASCSVHRQASITRLGAGAGASQAPGRGSGCRTRAASLPAPHDAAWWDLPGGMHGSHGLSVL